MLDNVKKIWLGKAAQTLLSYYDNYHNTVESRVGIRCGLIDAAGLCDAFATEIENSYRTKSGRIKKEGQMLAAMARICGDKICEVYDKVNVSTIQEK